MKVDIPLVFLNAIIVQENGPMGQRVSLNEARCLTPILFSGF